MVPLYYASALDPTATLFDYHRLSDRAWGLEAFIESYLFPETNARCFSRIQVGLDVSIIEKIV